MSVITGRRTPAAAPECPVYPRWRVPDLCRDFVESLVARARTVAGKDHDGLAVSVRQWDSLEEAAAGAPTLEEATGSVVTAGYVAARRIAGGAVQLFDEPDHVVPPHSTVRGRDTSLDQWSREVCGERLTETAMLSSGIGGVLEEVDAPRVDLPVEVPVQHAPVVPSAAYTAFTWLYSLGAILLLFVAWQLWGTSISQHHAQAQLHRTFEATIHKSGATRPSASGPVLIPADQVVAPPPEGSAVAHLQIPAIGLDEIVVSGTAEGDLARGPGHYIGTAAPGQAGNVAIAGHRTTNGAPFNQIGKLTVGNQIYLTTTTGERLTYIVSQPPVAVSPRDVAVLNDFGDDRVTLTTCNPEYSSSQRLVVVGQLQQPHPPKASKAKTVEYHIIDPATTSWGWSSLPVVVLALGVLLLLGLGNRWFTAWFGRSGRWIVLVPTWAGGLYLFFSTLTSFLPASM